MRHLSGGLTVALCIASFSCGPRRIALPGDSGTPLPEFSAIHEQVSAACRGARTFTAELSLRGRVGGQRISGRAIVGFERPASMRLEGLAPIGQPLFILAAQRGTGVLLLPRDRLVVRDQPAEAILDALMGVRLAPADLQAILTGCVVQAPVASGGRLHASGWASIDLQDGVRLYLRRASGGSAPRWELRAARRGGWELEYEMGQARFPASVRLTSDAGSVPVDLTAGVAQVEANVDLDAAAFRVDVPPETMPLTLDELRESSPLRAQ